MAGRQARAERKFLQRTDPACGAFVHLQKNRLRPSAALFKLAQTNLEKYPAVHERLNLTAVLALIAGWLRHLERKDFTINPLSPVNVPHLGLQK